MRGEFLIFDIIALIMAILINRKHKLGLFSYNKIKLWLTVIIAYYVAQTLALMGYARHWWDIGHNVLVGISLQPLYLEDAALYVIAPIVVIAVWERCLKFNKK